jgi:hypothetical protein
MLAFNGISKRFIGKPGKPVPAAAGFIQEFRQKAVFWMAKP